MKFLWLGRKDVRFRSVPWIRRPLCLPASGGCGSVRVSAPPPPRGFLTPGNSSLQLRATVTCGDFFSLLLAQETRTAGNASAGPPITLGLTANLCLASSRELIRTRSRPETHAFLNFSGAVMSNAAVVKFSQPEDWCHSFPIAVNGKRQSPIDILTTSCTSNDRSSPLLVSYPPAITAARVKNTGYGWTVTIPEADAQQTCLSGGPLQEKYMLEQFHAHWGADCGCGSEHTVDGRRFPAEVSLSSDPCSSRRYFNACSLPLSAKLHIVHWNRDVYKSFGEAVSQERGLSVLAVFLEVGVETNIEFEKLTSQLANIRFKGETTSLSQPLSLNHLLPGERSYFTYDGSLTTPPLYETVTWIVLKTPVKVSAKQIDAFRSICYYEKSECPAEGDGHIVQNFRPTQPLCDRVVVYSET